jgi:DNA polymerase-3 subunit epsilon
LQSRINGEPITRDVAETLAEQAGFVVLNSVTKKLDLLVVADPNTQSGKAKKARQYGTRILADSVFWRMIGVAVE